LYQDHFDLGVIRITERLRVGNASAKCAKVLGLATGAPILQIARVAYSFNDHPVELRMSYVNTSRCEYVPDNFATDVF
jgi:GntR family transcriptional regulator